MPISLAIERVWPICEWYYYADGALGYKYGNRLAEDVSMFHSLVTQYNTQSVSSLLPRNSIQALGRVRFVTA